MDQTQKKKFDRLERSGYLPVMRTIAQGMCAPFWWHGQTESGGYRIFHNGTVCFFDTGTKIVAVTADHVYQKYLVDKNRYRAFSCQIGGSTIEPEKYLIDHDERIDLATFSIPSVLFAPAGVSPHQPPNWPTSELIESEAVLYGGYPGKLREENVLTAEMPFQWFVSAVKSVSPESITLHVNMPNVYHPTHSVEEFNPHLGGMSGGPIFRVIDGPPADHLELVGFIYEYQQNLSVMLARHGWRVASDGTIIR